MASGDTLFILNRAGASPPQTLAAIGGSIIDASTPNATIQVLKYIGATNDTHMDWWLTVPSTYSGATGFTFSYKYAMDGTVGVVVSMEFRVVKLTDSLLLAGDLGIDTATMADVPDTPIATANDVNVGITPVAMPKADAGTPAVDDRIVIRGSRDYNHGANSDTLQLLEVLVTET